MIAEVSMIPKNTGGALNANGTSDDGETIRIPKGYLPGLADADIADVTIAIDGTPINLSFLSVTLDEETGDQIVTTVKPPGWVDNLKGLIGL